MAGRRTNFRDLLLTWAIRGESFIRRPFHLPPTTHTHIHTYSAMLSSLSTKLALKKVGLSSKDLDLSAFAAPSQTNTGKRTVTGDDAQGGGAWGTWMSNTSLPLKVTPWLSPPPPPVKLAPVPRIGQVAPLDRQRRLQLGGRTKYLVVFLRCVGCACKSYINPLSLSLPCVVKLLLIPNMRLSYIHHDISLNPSNQRHMHI